MIELRPFKSLGRFDNDWLSARYHFSFSGYDDPRRRGLGPLLVWNDDEIQPGTGFDMHGHRNMEIITYVREGAITHRDHLGNEGRTEAGDVQVMSAGKGILHAEHNEEPGLTRLFQIWIQPSEKELSPRWESRRFPKASAAGRLVALASGRAGHDEALPIHQDAALFGATLAVGQKLTHELGSERRGYLVVARGEVLLNGNALSERDGAAIAKEEQLEIESASGAEILLADLP